MIASVSRRRCRRLPDIISHANECAESLLEELAALMAEMPEETGLEPRFVALLLIHGVLQAAAVHFIVAGKSGLFATGDAETFVERRVGGFRGGRSGRIRPSGCTERLLIPHDQQSE